MNYVGDKQNLFLWMAFLVSFVAGMLWQVRPLTEVELTIAKNNYIETEIANACVSQYTLGYEFGKKEAEKKGYNLGYQDGLRGIKKSNDEIWALR